MEVTASRASRRQLATLVPGDPGRAAGQGGFRCELDAAFADEADDDETERRTQGHVIAACAVLDEWGVLVPDTLAVASFAWGLGHMLSGGAASALAGWDDRRAGSQGTLRQHS